MWSEDDTRVIAERFGARVVLHDREKFVEPARMFAVGHAKHEWVFLLDADERVPAGLGPELRRLVMEPDFPYAAVAIPMDDRFVGKRLQMWSTGWPNGKFSFSGRVHEGASIDGPVAALQVTSEDQGITHLAWDSIHHYIGKLNNYTDGEAEKLDAAGQRFQWRDGVREFVQEFAAYDTLGRLDGPLGMVVLSMQGLYRFLGRAKLYERHLAAGNLLPGENDVPPSVTDIFEYALEVARSLSSS
jgi:hypothetical protein